MRTEEFLILPHSVCGVLIFWNYYLCVSTDPGDVPSGWVCRNVFPRASIMPV